MSTITNDTEFRHALEKLGIQQQRAVAALFVEHLSALYDDERIKRVISLAKNTETPIDELQMAYKAAKAASIDSYTRCGADGD